MKLPKLLIFSLLVGMMPYHKVATASNQSLDCDLKVTYELKENPETKKTKVKLVFDGGERPFKVVLHNSKGKLQSLDFTLTEFDELEKGKYRCVILDKNECRAEISIDIN